DSPLPSGNAVAAMAMLDLDKPKVARRVLEVFAGQLARQAEGMSSMLQAAHRYVKEQGPIALSLQSNVHSREQQQRPRLATPEQIAAGVVGVQAAWVERT